MRSGRSGCSAARVSDTFALLPLDDALLEAAASLRPAGLRSLDALHLATALSVQDEIGAFLTYDERLAEAAEGHGLPVVRPA